MNGQVLSRSTRLLEWIAGLTLVLVLLLTICDVIGRALGAPIPGTYELVGFAGGLIMGFAVPASTRMKEQIRLDIVTNVLPRKTKLFLEVLTRLGGVVAFLVLIYGLVEVGNDLREAREVSSVLHLRFYCVAYGIAAGFIATVVVLLKQTIEAVMEAWKGGGAND